MIKINELEATVKEMESHNQDFINQNQNLKDSLIIFEKENKKLISDINSLKAQISQDFVNKKSFESLQIKYHQLEKKFCEVTEKFENNLTKIHLLESKNSDLNETNIKLSEELANNKINFQGHNKNFQKKEVEINLLQDKLELITKEINLKQASFEDLNKEIHIKSKEIDLLNNFINELKYKVSQLEAKSQNDEIFIKEEKEQNMKKEKKFEDEINKKSLEIEDLQTKSKEMCKLLSELENCKKYIGQKENEIQQLNLDIMNNSNDTKALNELSLKIQNLTKQNNINSNKFIEASEENRKLKDLISQIKSNENSQEINELRIKNDTLNEELNSKRNELMSVSEDIIDYRFKLEENKQILDLKDKNIIDLNYKLNEIEFSLKDKIKELSIANTDRENLIQKIDVKTSQEKTIKELNVIIQEINQNISSKDHQISELTEKISILNDQIKKLKVCII